MHRSSRDRDCQRTRRHSGGQGQAHLPAEQPAPGESPRLPAAYAYPCRPRHRGGAAPQGPSFSDCLTSPGRAPVLPARYRMTRSADFTHTVKHGVRASQPDLVVHGYRGAIAPDAGPRVGFIVAKSVGGAVDRHRVARKLRHAAHTVVDDLNPSDQVVVRALPGSRVADSAQLRSELRTGVLRIQELLERRR